MNLHPVGSVLEVIGDVEEMELTERGSLPASRIVCPKSNKEFPGAFRRTKPVAGEASTPSK